MKFKLLIFLVILLYACNKKANQNKVEELGKIEAYADTSFIQEYHEGFLVDTILKSANNVRAIQPDLKDNIWIATKSGVFMKRKDNTVWKLMITGEEQGPAYDVKVDNKGNLWAATWDGVYKSENGELEKQEGLTPPIAKLAISSEGIYALGPNGIWLFQNDEWRKKEYPIARSIRAVISDGSEGLWVGTDVGLYHCKEEKTRIFNKNEDLVSAYVKGLDYNDLGEIWVGGLGGISIRNETQKIAEKLPDDGLPNAEVNIVKKAPDGTMWVGTSFGITRFNPKEQGYSVRLGRRWLMSDEVRDIAFDKSGNAWIATSNGVSGIKRKKITLNQKAGYFYQQLIDRHVRAPWIIHRTRLAIAGDTTTSEPEDDDNDGEYTSMYLAMESFRYAATKNPEAKERAKKAFDFLHYLREVTGKKGFFARTIIPVDWDKSHDMNRTYTPQELAEEVINNPRQKSVEIRWHESADGKWKWKGDTSSDEMCGHFFGYYWYYNLVADHLEKERIANHVKEIMDHLLRNDFNLVDVDNQPTKWGIWSPKSLNHDPEWAPERALNSLEILSFLKFAFQITKDDAYQAAYLKLINQENYLENAKSLYQTNPAWETYFDIYLSLYIFPTLINYEEDPELKTFYILLLNRWFEKYKETKSPLVNFTYNLLNGGNDELENSIFFLKDAPWDLIDWEIDNGKREDLNQVRRPILEEIQVNKLRPPSEYRTIRWDNNPYVSKSGNSLQEKEPVYWLLPYWMGRYLQLIKNSN